MLSYQAKGSLLNRCHITSKSRFVQHIYDLIIWIADPYAEHELEVNNLSANIVAIENSVSRNELNEFNSR
jgi:hypothetical protein